MENITNHHLARLSRLVLIFTAFPFISAAQSNLTIETAIKIEFPTVSTNAYMLEQSTNLVDWTDSWQNWSVGSGYPISRFYEIKDQKLFYRLQIAPRPEVVTSTIPVNDDQNVDPSITNLYIYFSSDMDTNGSYGASRDPLDSSEAELPISSGYSGNPWIDARTFTKPLALKSNTLYYAKLRFTSSEGIPTFPFILTFKTKE